HSHVIFHPTLVNAPASARLSPTAPRSHRQSPIPYLHPPALEPSTPPPHLLDPPAHPLPSASTPPASRALCPRRPPGAPSPGPLDPDMRSCKADTKGRKNQNQNKRSRGRHCSRARRKVGDENLHLRQHAF